MTGQTLTGFKLTLGETYAILVHRAVNSKQYQFAEKYLRTYFPCDLNPFIGTCQTDVVELTAEQPTCKPDKGVFHLPPQTTKRASVSSAGPLLTTNERKFVNG